MKIIKPITVNDSTLTASNITENDHPEYVAGTTYSTGTKVIVISTHRIYESLQSSNTGNYPPDNTAKNSSNPYWKDLGATNKWRCFDNTIGNQSYHLNKITFDIDPNVIYDSIGFQNLEGVSLNVTLDDPINGEVYNETRQLVDTSNVNDWYTYYFNEILSISSLEMFDIPPYPDATTYLTIDTDTTDNTETAYCGEIVLGSQMFLGTTRIRPKISILDYSRKTVDDSGDFVIEERPFSKIMSVDLTIDDANVDYVFDTMSKYRATPLLYVANNTEYDATCNGKNGGWYSSLSIFGFYRDFSIIIAFPSSSQCSLEIEGLT